jgi:hypothetical protein
VRETLAPAVADSKSMSLNVAPSTSHDYIRCVERLAAYYGRSPEHLTQEEVRAFLVYLVTEAKVSNGVLCGFVSAFRFLNKITLIPNPTLLLARAWLSIASNQSPIESSTT